MADKNPLDPLAPVERENAPLATVIPLAGRRRRAPARARSEPLPFSQPPRAACLHKADKGNTADSEAGWASLRARLEAQEIDDDIARVEREVARGNVEALRTRAVLRNVRAMRSFLRGDREAAFAEWQGLLDEDPTLSGALLTRALFHARAGDLRAALADYDRAAMLWPNDAEVYLRRGLCYVELDDYDRALPNFLRVTHLRPRDPSAYLWLSRSLRARNNTEAAIRACGRAIQFAPWRGYLYAFRAGCFLDQDCREEALRDLDRCLELDPKDASSLRLRACLHTGEGKEARELSDLTRSLAIEPDHTGALSARARCHEHLGNTDLVLKDLSRALALDPRDASLRARRASAHLAKGAHAAAIDDLSAVIESEGGLVAASLWKRGLARLRLGDEDGARADCQRALAVDRRLLDDVRARLHRHGISEASDGLLHDLDVVILLDPPNADCLAQRARLQMARKQHARALHDLDRAIALATLRDALYHDRATALCNLGDFTRAAADEAHAIELSPSVADYHVWLGLYLALDGGPSAKAEVHVTRGVKLAPRSLTVLFLWAFYLQIAGRHEEAVRVFDRRVALDPALGILHFQRGEARLSLPPTEGVLRAALGDFDSAVHRGYARADVFLRRSEVQALLGNPAGATADRARAMSTTSPF